MSETDLPAPDSDELRELLTREDLRSLYVFLYDRRGNPPTMVEIRAHAAAANGESHSQTDRRVRELRDWFRLPAVRTGRVHVYQLEGRADAIQGGRSGISPKVRGEVLSAKRCAQCGRTPAEDHVKLEVDHMIPRSWGGTDDIENLQPLCTQCNHDKQAFYSSMDPFEEQIRTATAHLEPHRRTTQGVPRRRGGCSLAGRWRCRVDAPVPGGLAEAHARAERTWLGLRHDQAQGGWAHQELLPAYRFH